ncbi:CLUMA_CG004181, isoform A [Clunio marinus]|uniref:CLUMA_CG004181, isoform A n=1 Tax=Clunio marinus TaxID=568069 RepID=A0A1J1HSB4_9DIPT|nr:CLUMA_CG004181, isoform A [Clunio marinus]
MTIQRVSVTDSITCDPILNIVNLERNAACRYVHAKNKSQRLSLEPDRKSFQLFWHKPKRKIFKKRVIKIIFDLLRVTCSSPVKFMRLYLQRFLTSVTKIHLNNFVIHV